MTNTVRRVCAVLVLVAACVRAAPPAAAECDALYTDCVRGCEAEAAGAPTVDAARLLPPCRRHCARDAALCREEQRPSCSARAAAALAGAAKSSSFSLPVLLVATPTQQPFAGAAPAGLLLRAVPGCQEALAALLRAASPSAELHLRLAAGEDQGAFASDEPILRLPRAAARLEMLLGPAPAPMHLELPLAAVPLGASRLEVRLVGSSASRPTLLLAATTVTRVAQLTSTATVVDFARPALLRVQANTTLPVLPFGFYQYTVSTPADVALPGSEAISGMQLTSPYASVMNPTSSQWAALDAFMDRCAAVGFLVNFQLIAFEGAPNSQSVLDALTAQINRYKNHPALLAWYLADEPDGSGIDPSLFAPKYQLIKQLDPNHPVSMVFCTLGGALRFASYVDLIMVDPYPIPNAPAKSVEAAIISVAGAGKPIIMVPQAFGGGENWARSPSIQEERLMTMLGLVHGAIGIQYFVRSAPAVFPQSVGAWSEIRKMAAEVLELTPALLSGQAVPVNISVSSVAPAGAIEARAWRDRDGSVVVLVVNTDNEDPIAFTIGVPGVPFSAVTSIFENHNVYSAGGSFSDSLRGFGSCAYRLVNASTSAASAATAVGDANWVYNPSYESTVCPSVPDGNYVSQPGDLAATCLTDSRLSVTGRKSLRLHNPTAGAGVQLSPYTVPKITAGAAYAFSVQLRGAAGGEQVAFAFNNAIFAVKGGANPVVATATTAWQQVNVTLTGGNPGACPYNCRSWLSYSLSSNGTVWLDDLYLAPQ